VNVPDARRATSSRGAKSAGRAKLTVRTYAALKPSSATPAPVRNAARALRHAIAGLTVAIVALPLSIAIAIAPGVTPERGLYTSTLAGFVVMDFYDRREAALAELKSWVEDGRRKVREDIMEGLENLPGALIGLLAGDNVGKRMVKVV